MTQAKENIESSEGAPIHVDTRAQALADGVLIDVTPQAASRGYVFPVAITARVWSEVISAGVDVEKEPEGGEKYEANIAKLLDQIGYQIRRGWAGEESADVEVKVGPDLFVWVQASCGRDENNDRCLTIMAEGDD